MRKRIEKFRKKLSDTRGESIAEVLVAMLIIEMALIMAVAMIMSAGKMVKKSEETYDDLVDRKITMEQEASYTSKKGAKETFSAPDSTEGTITVKPDTDGLSEIFIPVTVSTVKGKDTKPLYQTYEVAESSSSGAGATG